MIVTRKFTIVYNSKILYRLWKKYMLSSLNFAWNLTSLKGNTSCRTYNFRTKSEMCKWSSAHNHHVFVETAHVSVLPFELQYHVFVVILTFLHGILLLTFLFSSVYSVDKENYTNYYWTDYKNWNVQLVFILKNWNVKIIDNSLCWIYEFQVLYDHEYMFYFIM